MVGWRQYLVREYVSHWEGLTHCLLVLASQKISHASHLHFPRLKCCEEYIYRSSILQYGLVYTYKSGLGFSQWPPVDDSSNEGDTPRYNTIARLVHPPQLIGQ